MKRHQMLQDSGDRYELPRQQEEEHPWDSLSVKDIIFCMFGVGMIIGFIKLIILGL